MNTSVQMSAGLVTTDSQLSPTLFAVRRSVDNMTPITTAMTSKLFPRNQMLIQ